MKFRIIRFTCSVIFIYFCSFFAWAGSAADIIVSDNRPYLGDSYQVTVKVDWMGDDRLNIPLFLEYQPPKGRKVLSIERKDNLDYKLNGDFSGGRTIFIINIASLKESDDTKGKVAIFYPSEDKKDARKEVLTVNERKTRNKIIGVFTLTESFFILGGMCAAGAAVVLLFRDKSKKKRMKLSETSKQMDRYNLELNAIGRLLDKKELRLFVDRSSGFIRDLIKELYSGAAEYNEKNFEFINDAELKRHVQWAYGILNDARFSSKELNVEEMEKIYEVCKKLRHLRGKKINGNN